MIIKGKYQKNLISARHKIYQLLIQKKKLYYYIEEIMILIDTLKETFIINPKKDKKYASNNSLYKYKLKKYDNQ